MPAHLRRYDEPGHAHFWTISCFRRLTFFHDDGMKRVAVAALRNLRDRFELCLVGYVIMPDHVHLVLYPHPKCDDAPVPISKLLHAFKQRVGYYGKQRLREVWRRHGQLWSDPLNRWALGEFGQQTIWTTRGYDFNIHDGDTLRTKLDYCHKNPLTRGLVDRADDWCWSSYRFYQVDDSSVLGMDWEGQWPIVW